jgi:hypothetical protein
MLRLLALPRRPRSWLSSSRDDLELARQLLAALKRLHAFEEHSSGAEAGLAAISVL